MPLLSPRRYQYAFRPANLSEIGWLDRFLYHLERLVKGALFGCRMCGNCILQETAFICPMSCAKGLRNGPCGGATSERCEVDPSRPCTWYLIYRRSEKMKKMHKLLEINAPLDGRRTGHESWRDLFRHWRAAPVKPGLSEFFKERQEFDRKTSDILFTLRQPDWWQGDDRYHHAAYEEPVSGLERGLRSGEFTITTEITPPLSASDTSILRKAKMLSDYVTAINFTDNASASPRMSSLASSVACLGSGIEPIYQIQARDRNRLAIQSDAIGASALGIRNILCITGDHQVFGAAPLPLPGQFDLDSIQMLWMLRRMRDEGIYLDGRPIKTPPVYFLGSAASPFSIKPDYEAIRTEKKINAGAQFIETQPVFDVDRFIGWLEALDKRNLLGKVHILAGLVPVKSAKVAHYMAEEVPGVVIPLALLERMDAAGDNPESQREAGFTIALEILQKLKALPSLSGVHIMAVHWEDVVPELVRQASLS